MVVSTLQGVGGYRKIDAAFEIMCEHCIHVHLFINKILVHT